MCSSDLLGTFSIVGKKIKVSFNEHGVPNLAPNWKETKELWNECEECREKKQIVYHTNSHSGGIRYRLHWSKKKSLIRNKTLYSFRLTRDNKRRINADILKGKEYFIK